MNMYVQRFKKYVPQPAQRQERRSDERRLTPTCLLTTFTRADNLKTRLWEVMPSDIHTLNIAKELKHLATKLEYCKCCRPWTPRNFN